MFLSINRKSNCGVILSVFACIFGCGESGAINAQKMIRYKHGPHIAQIVVEDLNRHTVGLNKAAERLARGFMQTQGPQLENEMRSAFKVILNPKFGIQELAISPMSFIAAVGTDGIVIARDAEPDLMKGMNLAEKFPIIKSALSGNGGFAIGQFQSAKKGETPSTTIVMAAPVRYQGKVAGAVVLGIPLWRLSQQLSRQLQTEQAYEGGAVLWVYVYRGDDLYHQGTPQSLDQAAPDGNARRLGLKQSPGGYTGSIEQFGGWYGFGVRPLRILGEDVGVVIFRMDPIKK